MLRLRASAGLALVLVACSANERRGGDLETSSPLVVLDRTADKDFELRALVAPTAEGFLREGDGVVSPGWRHARIDPRLEVGVRLGDDFTAATSIGVGRTAALTTTWRALDARPSRVEVEAGRALYRDVFRSTDAAWVARDAGVELFYVLRAPDAPSRFTWSIELPVGVSLRREAGGSLALHDARGEARLRIPRPWAVDANGNRRDAELAWDGARLEMTLDRSGLAYPVVLDPGIETIAWTRHAAFGPRDSTAMARLGTKLVLFGGLADNALDSRDTWEFDGTAWSLRTPTNAPSARQDHVMATVGTGATERVVLFGGCAPTVFGNGCTAGLDDTWEWDGTNWTPKTLATKPPPRFSAGAGTIGTRMVVFGGRGGAPLASLRDTWEWNGTGWSNKTAASITSTNTPSARYGHRVATYGANAVLFGGAVGSFVYSNETWEWNGTTWANKTVAAPTATDTPAGRHDFAMGTTSTGAIIIAGGEDSSTSQRRDTWTYDGAWTQKTPTANVGAFYGPTGATLGSSFYVIGRTATTWRYDGTTWSAHWKPNVPSPRNNARVAALGDKIVLFGGSSGGYLSDTWEWGSGAWTLKTPANVPPARHNHAMATLGSKVVMFGGRGSSSHADTWEWDGVDWTPKITANAPTTKSYASLTPFGSPRRLVLFGGSAFSNDSNETWEYDGVDWTKKEPVNPPAARTMHGSATLGDKALIFGGTGSTGFDDTWAWDGGTWSNVSGTTRPPGQQPAMATLGSKIVLAPAESTFTGSSPWVRDATAWSPRTPTVRPIMTSYSNHSLAAFGSTAVLYEQVTGETWTLDLSMDQGSTCGADGDCGSGFCRDGVCCATACPGACEACAASLKVSGVDGVCGPIKADTDPRSRCADSGSPACTTDGMCDGLGACRAYASSTCTPRSCTAGSECASGFCVDGICCDKACGGACEACTQAKKGAGVDGVCEPVAAGSDPKSRCDVDPGFPNSCKQDGACDGAGSCRLAATGAACGATSCNVATNEVSGSTCDGVGVCSTAPKSCAPYKCNAGGTACASTCTTDGDCTSAAFCTSGVCTPKRANGTSATDGRECASGFLADGVCCISACTGTCEACDVAGSKGACAPVVGAAKHGTCPAASGADPCGARVCDGVNTGTCGGFVGAEVSCRPASCKDGLETASAKCEGKGSCPAASTRKCEPLACDETAAICKASCKADADCTGGTKCELSSGKCVSSASCIDDHTLQPLAGAAVDCTPYTCAGSECRVRCSSSSDCVSGFACDTATQVCAAASSAPPGEESSGRCTVDARGGRGRGAASLLLAFVAVLAVARRRRRAALLAVGLAAPACSATAPSAPSLEELARTSAAVETTAWTQKTFAPAKRFVGLYASLGNKIVFFGSSDGGTTLRQTWEWDGAAWTLKNPATSPTGVTYAMATRTPATGSPRVVLVGGTISGSVETWEYDGITWSKKTPATSPTAREQHMLAAVGSKVVMFGGWACTSAIGSCTRARVVETWDWDGTTWTNRTPASNNPAPRRDFTLATFGTTKAVLFGGRDCTTSPNCTGNVPRLADTWEWNGTAWSSTTTATTPSIRSTAGATAFGGKVVMFGGDYAFSSAHYDDSTWEYDGTNWSIKSVAVTPTMHTSPGMVTFTPSGGTPRIAMMGESDFWELDGTNWTPRQVTAAPVARYGHAMATIGTGAAARVILFGGYNDLAGAQGCPYSNLQCHRLLETWEWNGTTWTLRAPPVAPTWSGPMATAGANIVMFDGNLTWEWNGTTWTKKGVAGTPPTRKDAAMASTGSTALLFAGEGLQDTWEWDGAVWNQRAPAKSPPSRLMHAMTGRFDGKVLLFGGYAGDSDEGTWSWDGTTWSDLTPSPIPTAYPQARGAAAMASLGSKTILFGGMLAAPDPLLWTFQDGAWTGKSVAGPSARNSHALATLGNSVVLFGGETSNGVQSAETWTLTSIADAGSKCFADADCDTGFCRDGVCCTTACSGTCQACAASFKQSGAGDGTCGPAKVGLDPRSDCKDSGSPTCQQNGVCDGAGACQSYPVASGCAASPCTTGAECASGFCTDGVCCDKACAGACEACSAAVKGSGVDGTCAPVPSGAKPAAAHGTCAASTEACKADGACDGLGSCRAFAVAGAPCGATSCAGASVSGTTCDGVGTCSSAPKACAPFACNPAGTACATTCTTDANCDAAAFCASNGVCLPKRTNGETAAEPRECRSGVVADKVCCDKACAGICEACDTANSKGACAPVAGSPRHGSCVAAPSGGDPCAAEICDGKVGDTCAGRVGADVDCRMPGCTDGASVTAAKCTGSGTCPAATPTPCAPYSCGASACKTTCAVDGDCADGNRCDVANAKCVSGTSCKDDRTVVSPSGEESSCAPLKCADAKCLTKCATSDDCVSGFACETTSSTCVAAAGGGGDEGGCAYAHGKSRASASVALLVLFALAARGRRARR